MIFMKNDLIKICDALEECKKYDFCDNNEVVCARAHLKKYIGDDYNKLLKLKTLLDIDNHYKMTFEKIQNLGFSIATFILSVTTIISTLREDIVDGDIIWEVDKHLILIVFTLIAVICIAKLVNSNKNSKRNEWKYYIRTCLPEIEKELFPKVNCIPDSVL